MISNSASDKGVGRRITRYGSILGISGIFCKLMVLGYTLLAVEILGQEKFGRIEYFMEMAIIFCVLIDFGLEQTITREIARRRDRLKNVLRSLFYFRLTISIVGGIIMMFLLAAVGKPEHTWSLIVCAVFFFFAVLHMMFIRSFVRSLELLSMEGIANILEKIVHIGLAIPMLLFYPHLPPVFLCYTAGSLVSVAFYWKVILQRVGWSRRTFKYSEWFEWQKLAVPIGLSSACVLLLHREDTAMINWIWDDSETGLYRAPYRIFEGLFLFPQVLSIAAYPVFSKLYHENRPFSRTAGLFLRGLMIIAIPMAVGGTCVADDLVTQLLRKVDPRACDVFKILVWSLPFIFANFLLGAILNATDRQRKNLQASAWGLVSNAILNVPAILLWGALGASVMTVISQGLYGVLMSYHTRDLHLFTEGKRYLAILAASLIMALVILSIQLPWYFAILLGATVYAISLLLLRGISREDIENLFRVLRNR